MIHHISDNEFAEEVLTSRKPVLVEFWAPWCDVCNNFDSKLNKLSEDYDSKVKFIKVNIEENDEIANRFKIEKLPSFLIFNNREIVDFVIGAESVDTFKSLLNEVLNE